MARTRVTLTMPVLMSTFASANCTPEVFSDVMPGCQSACAGIAWGPIRLHPAPAAAPRADCDAHAGLDRSRRRVACRMPLVPAEFRRAFAQVAAPHLVGRFRRQILEPELDWIHLHQIRELVHHDFGEERCLRM